MLWTTNDKYRTVNMDDKIFDGVGKYNIPVIKPEHYDEDIDFIGFNYAKSCKDRADKGVHFFIDDYQFERVWRDYKRYTEMLAQFKAVMSPTFSMFADWPVAVQIWNFYRRHFIAAYLQLYGVKVFPSIGWTDKKSYEWCFDGEPTHSCIAVESIGTQKNDINKKVFLHGYDAMLEHLQPETILFYGKIPKECRGNIIPIEPFQNRFDKIRKGAKDNETNICSDNDGI